ncbi:Os03g0410000, partial [Oryza sativa Japonica Group]
YGHDPSRVMPCLGWAKMACLGPGHGPRAIWPSILKTCLLL